MKTTLKLTTLLLTLTFVSPLMAQSTSEEENGGGENLTAEQRAEKRTEKMTTELSLTEAQKTKVYQINLEHIVQMDKYHEEQKALKEKMKAEREATRGKIKAVLTPEQNVIFDQKAEEHKQKQEDRHKECKH